MDAITHESTGVHIAHTHPNPIRGRFNAAFFRWMDWYVRWKFGAMKRRLFADLPDTIVELGAGTGANFRYMRRGTKVIAVEPNTHMHAALRQNAARFGIELEIRSAGAEGIELESDSVDTVVCSLVLCTVDDPEQVVGEVRRILKPGGRFLCIEHVAAPADTMVGRIQRWVFRPWRWLFEGCHTHRDTGSLLQGSGFAEVSIEPFTVATAFVPVRPQILARCVA